MTDNDYKQLYRLLRQYQVEHCPVGGKVYNAADAVLTALFPPLLQSKPRANQMTLLNKLLTADVVCSECGQKYGKYSVGCSSVWNGTCGVCGEDKPVTEVRDYGYLTKGIRELKGEVKEQSKKVADYMLSVGPIMNDDELDNAMYDTYRSPPPKESYADVVAERDELKLRLQKLLDERG